MKISCITCGTYIFVGNGSTKFHCPQCDKVIGRCPRCRELGKRYTCECGFQGP